MIIKKMYYHLLLCNIDRSILFVWFPDIDECVNTDICNNGTCLNNDGGFTCLCATGFTGLLCEAGKFLYDSFMLYTWVGHETYIYHKLMTCFSDEMK